MNHNYNLIISIVALTLLFLMLAVFFISIIVMYKRKKQQHIKEKEHLQTEFSKSLLQTQIEIQEQTLKTISQEIHDNVGQVLSLAKLNLGTFEDTESALNQTKINDTKQLVSKAINDLRDLSKSMNGDKVADIGLKETIENELKIITNTGQFVTLLKVTGEPFNIIPQNKMVLFRILQESLNNVLKHSKAHTIMVLLNYQKELFNLQIEDDGIGFDTATLEAHKTGIGLLNMKSRAKLIGASFSIQSKQGVGTKVMVQLKRQTR